MILTHAGMRRWYVGVVERELGARVVGRLGTWEAFSIHGEQLVRRARREAGDAALAAVGLAQEALAVETAILVGAGSAFAGPDSARNGQYFNAAVYIAHRLGLPILSVDRHFPTGTWKFHLKLGIPLAVIYSGPEGPPLHRVRGIPAFPLPPGAGDVSLRRVTEEALRRLGEGGLVLQLGFDMYAGDPQGEQFATAAYYHWLGARLAGRRPLYVLVECVNTLEEVREGLGAFTAGLRGLPPPPGGRHEESEAVRRDVDRLVRRR